MQPIRIVIPGEYWDSFVYEGRLYLFDSSGEIKAIDWDQLINEWRIEESLRFSLTCAFSRSDYLYGSRWDLLFQDAEMKNLIVNKFNKLAQIELSLDATLDGFVIGTQENRFPFPHNDATIYKRRIYVAGQKGIYSASCNKKTQKPVSTRIDKATDMPALTISASYDSLAIAGGDEGAFDFNLGSDYWSELNGRMPKQLDKRNCIDVNWAYYNLYCSSHVKRGYLVEFDLDVQQNGPKTEYNRKKREVLLDDKIFHSAGYSWGNQDKLSSVKENLLKVVRYNPWADRKEEQKEDLGTVQIGPLHGNIVSGKTALFGSVLEDDDSLIILPSIGEPLIIKGEPVNWRIFPRSKHYENHLHIIYNDRLEVWSFNHDYFIDQKDKMIGTKYSAPPIRK